MLLKNLHSLNVLIKRLSFLVTSWFAMLLGCNSLSQEYRPAVFPIEQETIYLYPIQNNSLLDTFSLWPATAQLQENLKQYFAGLDKNIASEFRRCQKFGLYQIATDSAMATVRIRLTMLPAKIQSDTLFLPLRLQAEVAMDMKIHTDTIAAIGIYQTAQPVDRYKYVGMLLTDWVYNFPYAAVTNRFYAQSRTTTPRLHPQ